MSALMHNLPPALRAIARSTMPASKREQQALIRAIPARERGGLTLSAALDACLAAREQAATLRRARPALRIVAGLGYCPVDAARRPCRASIHRLASIAAPRPDAWLIDWREPSHGTPATHGRRALPAGTPAERLATARKRAILPLYLSTYRQATHGDASISLTDDPAAVGITQRDEQDWQGYSRSTKYPMRLQYTVLTVPAQWRARVARRGLDTVDGMLTLDAAPLTAPDGVELYAATWLVQGRGTSVTAARGYIARAGQYAYHADTADAALAGLGRKTRAAGLTAAMADMLARSSLPELAARAPADAVVRLADARAVGACEYGIKSWCHTTGLPYDAGSAPLASVVAAWQREPRSEARAAILRALRRYSRTLLAAA